VLFFALLVALALLATFDPWYRRLVHPNPWVGNVFFLVSVFGALNLALPLVGVPPFGALQIAAWMAMVALTPAVCRERGWSWIYGAGATIVAGGGLGVFVSAGGGVIPPAPLFLARTAIGWAVGSVESLEPVLGTVSVAELRERGLIAYTAIYAPAGLLQPVEHVWRDRKS